MFIQGKTARERRKKQREQIFEICIFAMLGALMFCSKLAMEFLPNIHLLGVLTMVYTIAFRAKALIPIYIYVFLNGLFAGFNMWWVPYLYIWAILWGVTMLLPRKMPAWVASVVYPTVCALHGLLFGVLYAPAQAVMFGLDFSQTVVWIAQGLWFDLIHCVGNFAVGLLILPLSQGMQAVLKKRKYM